MPRLRLRPAAVACLLTAAALAACGDDAVGPDDFEVIEEAVFAPELGIDLAQFTRTSSGLYVRDLVFGDGATPTLTDSVQVTYTGWLRTGEEFDSGTRIFPVGQLIPGFTEALLGMKVGGTRVAIVPPALGYGAAGRPGIPGGAILVFEISLLEIR